MKHTPGPWHSEKRTVVINTQAIIISAADDIGPVAFSTKGNDKLIAAAPDLLEALEKMSELVKDYHKEVGSCDHSVGICLCGEYTWLEEAKKAIAKATK